MTDNGPSRGTAKNKKRNREDDHGNAPQDGPHDGPDKKTCSNPHCRGPTQFIDCFICTESVEGSGALVVCPNFKCSRIMHEKCFLDWKESSGNDTCPLCKESMYPTDHRLLCDLQMSSAQNIIAAYLLALQRHRNTKEGANFQCPGCTAQPPTFLEHPKIVSIRRHVQVLKKMITTLTPQGLDRFRGHLIRLNRLFDQETRQLSYNRHFLLSCLFEGFLYQDLQSRRVSDTTNISDGSMIEAGWSLDDLEQTITEFKKLSNREQLTNELYDFCSQAVSVEDQQLLGHFRGNLGWPPD